MKRIARKLAALCVLTTAALILLASPESSYADWASCDADFMNRTQYCIDQYNTCVATGGSNCQRDYNSCLDQSGTLKTECINTTDPTPQPLPVIDQSRSICMSACYYGCDYTDFVERFACYSPCYTYCNENYPKP